MSGDLLDGMWTALNVVAGAALGASFYILLKTQPYLVNRSFDPKYNAAYISRFITGLTGGVILATAIGPSLGNQLGGTTGATLTPGVLAILGGYAAEAVELMLQRLVETLSAAVRGDSRAEVQAKATAEQLDRNAKLQELLPDLELARTDETKFKETIQKLRATIKASK